MSHGSMGLGDEVTEPSWKLWQGPVERARARAKRALALFFF